MICRYLPCDKEAGKNSNGIQKYYCCNDHKIMERKRKANSPEKVNPEYHYGGEGNNVEADERANNKTLLTNALTGDTLARIALELQGLTYHYRRGEGEWGESKEAVNG